MTVGTSRRTDRYTTTPRATLLISALTSAQTACEPNIRLTPASGLSRFAWGLSSFGLNQMPPCTAAEATPMTAIVLASGRTRPKAARAESTATAIARPGSGSWMTLPTWTIAVRPTSTRPLKRPGRRNVATRKPAHVPSSGVLPICPSRRAFFRRFGVAFSVFSPPPPPPLIGLSSLRSVRPPGDCCAHGSLRRRRSPGHHPDEVIGLTGELDDDARQQGEADADEHQGQADLQREGQRERVELRGDAVEHAEGDVGDEEHDDQRAGDLEGGDEQAVEGV